MANSNDANVAAWVERRMAMLGSPGEWDPNIDVGLRRFSPAGRATAAWIRTSIWIGAAACAIGLSLALWTPTLVFARGCIDACLAQAGIAGKVLRNRMPGTVGKNAELVPLGDRKAAADFAERDQWSNTVRLSDLRGHIVVLDFWATWCAPCRKEIPSLDELQRKYRQSGLVVLGVSLDDDGWRSVKPFMRSNAMHYRVMSGLGMVPRSYPDVTVLPMTFLIDKHGRVAARHPGLVDKSLFEKEIAELLREK